MDYLNQIQQQLDSLYSGNIGQWSTTTASSFALIAAAEIGDKSQLVCMTLASRHRAMPVLLGAVMAFALLNTLAVVFGAAIAAWFPAYLVAATVAVLFFVFGLHALFAGAEDEDHENIREKTGHRLFITTFLLITVAEFGDKTQLAVVALSSSALPAAVWIGATIALAATSALGIVAGRTVLQQIPLTLLHRLSGVMFLCLATYAGYTAYLNLPVTLKSLQL